MSPAHGSTPNSSTSSESKVTSAKTSPAKLPLTITRQLKQKGLSVQPPIPRFVRLTVVLAMIATLSVAMFQYWGRSQYRATAVTAATAAPDNGWTQTQWGPLGPADRDLLIKVRQGRPWGGAAGAQAPQRGGRGRGGGGGR